MMSRSGYVVWAISLWCAGGCTHAPSAPTDSLVTLQQVLSDFAVVVVNPNYRDLQDKSTMLYSAVTQLDSEASDSNLSTAQNAWRAARHPWEMAEGYLFGPIEDFNYDPSVDTWPLNRVELDSLLASASPLTVSDIDALPYSLKGFHALEYVLFGAENPPCSRRGRNSMSSPLLRAC
jgi:putative iron-regulated protein